MKKYLLSIAVMVGCVYTLTAQKADLRFTGGFTYSHLWSDPPNSRVDHRYGIMAGVDVIAGSKFFVNTGIHYNAINSRETSFSDLAGELSSQNWIHTIRVPLYGGYRFFHPATRPLVNVRLFTGPAANFIVGVDDDGAILRRDDYHDGYVGWDFGAGLDIWYFFVDVGYEVGMTPVFKTNDDSRNNMFWANTGVRIRF